MTRVEEQALIASNASSLNAWEDAPGGGVYHSMKSVIVQQSTVVVASMGRLHGNLFNTDKCQHGRGTSGAIIIRPESSFLVI